MSVPAVQELDELLFDDRGWFAIDERNQAVPGVRVPSLPTGLALIGDGAVATLVGRVRPGIRVVDVDAEGATGVAIVQRIAGWCRQRDLWHLVRPSGGAPGRAHVFVAAPDDADHGGDVGESLAAAVEDIRSDLGAPARAIDLRRSGHVRPLSAPHRTGRHTRPLGDLRAAARALRRLDATTKVRNARNAATGHRAVDRRRAAATARSLDALTPRARRRVELPEAWATYLRTGTPPPHGGQDHSRSTDELLATAAMLRCGHDAASAWALIATAHPAAMVKARHNRRRWTEHVWNRLVVDLDHSLSPTSEARAADPEHVQIAGDVAAARDVLHQLAWSVSPRRRRALLLVGHHLLDRIERTGQRRIPAPERDLVLDTGLVDRKTIRAALRTLTTAPGPPDAPGGAPAHAGLSGAHEATGALGVLHTDAWDPLRAKDSSSFEFELATVDRVREIPPPSFHTPYPGPPPGTWASLPGAAHALWRALLAAGRPTDLSQLTRAATLTKSPHTPATASELRTAHAALLALGRAGLVTVDSNGRWSTTPEQQATPEVSERALRHHQELAAAVAAERAAYRAASADTWSLERARARKAQLAKERAWWAGLDPSERAARRERWQATFQQLSIVDQEQLKDQFATRRRHAGADEAARHRAWIESLTRAEYTARVIEHRRRYERLAPALQQASVAAWERHRARHGVERHPTISPTEPASAVAGERGVRQIPAIAAPRPAQPALALSL